MLSRVGDYAHSSQLRAILIETQSRMRATQEQVATGKRARSYDDIPRDSGILLRTRSDRDQTATFIQENEYLVDRLQVMDGALGSIVDIAIRMRTLMIQRLDDATGNSVPLKVEIDAMSAEVESQLNKKVDGRFLFSGTSTDVQPVVLPSPLPTVADPTTYYQGDYLKLSARVDAQVEISYGVTAGEQPFAQLFAAMGEARDAHVVNDDLRLQAATDQLTSALEALAERRSELGMAATRIENLTDSQHGALVYLDETISRIEDTDLPSAMARLAQDRTSLEAAYITISQLSQLSLASYL